MATTLEHDDEEDVCAVCTAMRPRLCAKHYEQAADRFVEAVKKAIEDQQTPSGVKATYEQLLEMNAALRAQLATVTDERDEQNKFAQGYYNEASEGWTKFREAERQLADASATIERLGAALKAKVTR